MDLRQIAPPVQGATGGRATVPHTQQVADAIGDYLMSEMGAQQVFQVRQMDDEVKAEVMRLAGDSREVTSGFVANHLRSCRGIRTSSGYTLAHQREETAGNKPSDWAYLNDENYAAYTA